MKSNRFDGRPNGLQDERVSTPMRYEGEAPPAELVELIAQSRARLGLFESVHYFHEVGSTNDVAAALTEGAVVLAERQTAGRGRRGHTWFSPAGSGVYASLVLAPRRSTSDPSRATTLLTLAAGVALAEGIDASTDLHADLKWPNDLYVGRRKLAGILAESSGEQVVLGFGINTSDAAYPADLRDHVTSIESELRRAVDRYRVFVESLAAMSRRYDDLIAGRFDAILDAWRRRAPAAVGASVERPTANGRERGVTAGIDDHGGLMVRVGDRTERVTSGEITWL